MIQGLVYDNVFLAVKLLGDTDLTHFCFLEFVRLYHHICMRGIRDEEFSVFVCLGFFFGGGGGFLVFFYGFGGFFW